MNILKTLILASSMIYVCLVSTVFADTSTPGFISNSTLTSGVPIVQVEPPIMAMNNLPASGVQIIPTVLPTITTAPKKMNPILSVVVGTPFNIKLNEDKQCISTIPLDQIKLLINGIETGLHPLGCDPATEEITFAIKKEGVTISPVTNMAWEGMFGRPWNTISTGFQRELNYTVSQPADSPNAQVLSSGKLSLQIAKLDSGLIGAGMAGALWIALIYLGRNSGMLRDDGNQGDTLQNRTFSLGRVQMAWWFGIVMGAYIFLWMMSQEIPALGNQALLLMGISGAIGLTSVGLNSGMQKPQPVSSGNFFEDLLTDAYGITLHRFQLLAVTIILGIMFIIHVATTLTMPEFDGSLLALMGIAGGTYAGFKIPETQVDASNSPSLPVNSILEEHKVGYSPEPTPNNSKQVTHFGLGGL
jgi:hypothetical protein